MVLTNTGYKSLPECENITQSSWLLLQWCTASFVPQAACTRLGVEGPKRNTPRRQMHVPCLIKSGGTDRAVSFCISTSCAAVPNMASARAGWGQNVCARTTAAHGHIGRYKTGGIAYQVPSVGWYRAVHPNRSTPTITRRKRRRDREWVRTRSLFVVGLACTKNKINK